MSRVPKNVQKLLAQNNAITAAREHMAILAKGNTVAQWHERDLQRAGNRNTNKLAGTRSMSSNPMIALQEGILRGVEVAKLARQARLRELFAAEALAYEQELHALGLALVKPRD